MKNTLYYGDNLEVLRRHVQDESVDLVYLDPPFKSNVDYNVLFAEQNGSRAKAQIKAFEDTWQWDQEAAKSFQEVVEMGGRVSVAMQSFRGLLGESDMLAYLAMMAPRLVQLRRVLKPTGSIYLHCDTTASHYLKILMDAVFGPEQFRNEIIWRRTGSHNSPRRFGRIHDTILFYSKTNEYFFVRTCRPYLKGHVDSYFKQKDDRGRYWTNALTGAGTTKSGDSGRPWRSYDPTAVGRHWAIPGRVIEELGIDPTLTIQEKLDALDDAGLIDHPTRPGAMPTYRQYLDLSPGIPLQDIWAYQPHTRGVLYGTDEGVDEDVRWLVKQGDPERLGYQTQKPEGVLTRIVSSSCPAEGIVLDPFCGCGTAIVVAQRLKRAWVGIDITQAAIVVIKQRLADSFGQEVDYQVIGEPVTFTDAMALAAEDPYQFQWWALGLVGARPVEEKKGRDKGIDGRLYFHDEPQAGTTKQIIFSVKSRQPTVSHVRDLRGVIEREKAQIGVLITMESPTKAMREEAASGGFYESPWGKHPKIQIITIAELLEGRRVDYPPSIQVDRTFQKPPPAKAKGPKTMVLPLDQEER